MGTEKIVLSAAQKQSSVAVSYAFIDRYMPNANGSFVKVYLYLLRVMNDAASEVSIAYLADCLSCTETDIVRALNYWEKQGLLLLSRDDRREINGITLKDLPEAEEEYPGGRFPGMRPESSPASSVVPPVLPEVPAADTAAAAGNAGRVPERHAYSGSQLVELTGQDEVKFLLTVAEQYLERPLKPTDQQLILYLYEDLHFSADLIVYLYEYCVSRNKKSASYIESVAIAWSKAGITTAEQAEEASAAYNARYNAVNRAFGLNRTPGQVEQDIINHWYSELHSTDELVREACGRTLLAIGKPDFKYADSILVRWQKSGVKSLEDVKQLDTEHSRSSAVKSADPAAQRTERRNTANQFQKFPQRTYTPEELGNMKRRLLNKRGS